MSLSRISLSTFQTSRCRTACMAASALAVLGAFSALSLPALAQKSDQGTKAAAKNPQVQMVIEKRGTLTIELFSREAPKTVAHFLDLTRKKFYDGILFHRYEPGFVVQGGDPKSRTVDGAKIADIPSRQVGEQYGLGMGGSGSTVPLEAKAPHTRGTLGLARSQDPNSGDSQFFFNLKDNHQLDSGYCVFGKIVKGVEIMDALRQGDKIKSVRELSASGAKPAAGSKSSGAKSKK